MLFYRSQNIIIGLISFFPTTLVVSAQTQDFAWLAGQVTGFLTSLIPVLSSLALLLFFWGMVEYVFQAGDEGAVEAGRNRMIVGLLGMFAIAAVWGLTQLVGNTFNIL